MTTDEARARYEAAEAKLREATDAWIQAAKVRDLAERLACRACLVEAETLAEQIGGRLPDQAQNALVELRYVVASGESARSSSYLRTQLIGALRELAEKR